MLTRLARRSVTLALVGVASALVLAGCGSSSSTVAGTPQRFSTGGPGDLGISAAQQRKIRSCLEAAGLASAIPTGRPSGAPPSGTPTDGFSRGAQQAGAFGSPEVQAALTACGITLPTRPTSAPTSG